MNVLIDSGGGRQCVVVAELWNRILEHQGRISRDGRIVLEFNGFIPNRARGDAYMRFIAWARVPGEERPWVWRALRSGPANFELLHPDRKESPSWP